MQKQQVQHLIVKYIKGVVTRVYADILLKTQSKLLKHSPRRIITSIDARLECTQAVAVSVLRLSVHGKAGRLLWQHVTWLVYFRHASL